jgi:hypothetical protein
MIIKIAEDFTPSPGPRLIAEGPGSGELFRTTVLFPKVKEAIAKRCTLTIDLDGASGYGTSFLEESFGGLIRENKLDLAILKALLVIISTEEPDLLDEIREDMEEAQKMAETRGGG